MASRPRPPRGSRRLSRLLPRCRRKGRGPPTTLRHQEKRRRKIRRSGAAPAHPARRGRPPDSRLQRRLRRSQLFRQARPLRKRPGALHRPLSPPVESVPGGAQHPRPQVPPKPAPKPAHSPLNAFKNTGLQNEPKKWGGMHNTHPGPKSPAPSPQPRARKRPNPQPPLINSIEPNAQNRTPLRHGIYLPPRPSGPHQLP